MINVEISALSLQNKKPFPSRIKYNCIVFKDKNGWGFEVVELKWTHFSSEEPTTEEIKKTVETYLFSLFSEEPLSPLPLPQKGENILETIRERYDIPYTLPDTEIPEGKRIWINWRTISIKIPPGSTFQ